VWALCGEAALATEDETMDARRDVITLNFLAGVEELECSLASLARALEPALSGGKE
jgi:hypothetical protein